MRLSLLTLAEEGELLAVIGRLRPVRMMGHFCEWNRLDGADSSFCVLKVVVGYCKLSMAQALMCPPSPSRSKLFGERCMDERIELHCYGCSIGTLTVSRFRRKGRHWRFQYDY